MSEELLELLRRRSILVEVAYQLVTTAQQERERGRDPRPLLAECARITQRVVEVQRKIEWLK